MLTTLGMCGTGWVGGQPCDDCRVLTKTSSHNLQGGKKKAFSLLCPDMCRSWHLCRLTIEDLSYSCCKRSGTWHFSWALSPNWQDLPLTLSFQDKCQQVMNSVFFHSCSFRAWISVSAEFMNGKCQALCFFQSCSSGVRKIKGRWTILFFPPSFILQILTQEK